MYFKETSYQYLQMFWKFETVNTTLNQQVYR